MLALGWHPHGAPGAPGSLFFLMLLFDCPSSATEASLQCPVTDKVLVRGVSGAPGLVCRASGQFLSPEPVHRVLEHPSSSSSASWEFTSKASRRHQACIMGRSVAFFAVLMVGAVLVDQIGEAGCCFGWAFEPARASSSQLSACRIAVRRILRSSGVVCARLRGHWLAFLEL